MAVDFQFSRDELEWVIDVLWKIEEASYSEEGVTLHFSRLDLEHATQFELVQQMVEACGCRHPRDWRKSQAGRNVD